MLEIIVHNHTFLLLPEKAVFWKKQKALIIADIHLGKATHFRKHGMALPVQSSEKDYELLQKLIEKFLPEKIFFLGDLFHSDYNAEWNRFKNFRMQNSTVGFVLIKGNHDVLPVKKYTECNIEVIDKFQHENILLLHENNVTNNKAFTLSGHIHPGIKLKGKGKQTLSLPCFYQKENELILPAFGSLTGLYFIQPEKKEEVYVVAANEVVRLPKK
jgi:DNA ligase-associated metallophosphoesterase